MKSMRGKNLYSLIRGIKYAVLLLALYFSFPALVSSDQAKNKTFMQRTFNTTAG